MPASSAPTSSVGPAVGNTYARCVTPRCKRATREKRPLENRHKRRRRRLRQGGFMLRRPALRLTGVDPAWARRENGPRHDPPHSITDVHFAFPNLILFRNNARSPSAQNTDKEGKYHFGILSEANSNLTMLETFCPLRELSGALGHQGAGDKSQPLPQSGHRKFFVPSCYAIHALINALIRGGM